MTENVGSTRRIGELDNLDLSRLIAEEMGWKAWQSKHGYWNLDGPGGQREIIEMGPAFDGNTGKKLDRSKWWTMSSELPNFVTDPAMTMMLLEKLIQQGFKPAFIDLNSKETRLITATKNGKGNCVDGVLGRTIAEAYALAHGLGEK